MPVGYRQNRSQGQRFFDAKKRLNWGFTISTPHPILNANAYGFWNVSWLRRCGVLFALYSLWDASEGRLINVQPVGASRHGFDPDSTVIYGIGAFISVGSEVYKRVGGKPVAVPVNKS